MKCIWKDCENEAIGEEESENISLKLEGVDFSKICRHHCTQLENITELGSKSDIEKACAFARGEEPKAESAGFLLNQEELKKLFEALKEFGEIDGSEDYDFTDEDEEEYEENEEDENEEDFVFVPEFNNLND
jgi:hypothetical protein